MDEMTESRFIHRFEQSGKITKLKDEVIKESRLAIRMEGTNLLQVVLSPFMIEEYMLGFLLTRGLIGKREDLVSLTIGEGEALVERVANLRDRVAPPNILESTGAKNIDLKLDPHTSRRLPDTGFSVPVKVLIEGVGRLSKMPFYNRTGGTHCAIVFSPTGQPLVSAEDIGRHNSVDKAIGGAMKKGIDFSTVWLAVSGRLPADMVLKAVVAGIPLIASVSAPTSMGISIGEKTGVTVIGFAKDKRFNCYCHPERITPTVG